MMNFPRERYPQGMGGRESGDSLPPGRSRETTPSLGLGFNLSFTIKFRIQPGAYYVFVQKFLSKLFLSFRQL